MTREQIIFNMCMTFRHDYGLTISEDDKMYIIAVVLFPLFVRSKSQHL